MNNCTLTFSVIGGICFSVGNELTVSFADGILTVEARYTANERSLVLRGEAKPGDTACLTLRDYRIELAVNGIQTDEEWPFGDALFTDGELTENTPVTVGELPVDPEVPAFCGSFTDAEGWYPGNGVFVGDCMPYSDGERYHVLYLKDRHHHGSNWGKGAHQWAHISTTDLVHWDVHPMAVEIDDPAEGSICTGSWIFVNGVHQLYYTVRMSDGSSAPIRRSLSKDGYHYEKDKDFRFLLSDRYTGASARDPKVVMAEDGTMHMFVTTTLRAEGKGCLVHLTSEDGDNWHEIGEIYVSPDRDEPECSDYFALNGRYYLIFSHHGSGQYRISDKPFSDWKEPAEKSIPCHSVPKAAIWHNRIIFAGFKRVNGYAGYLTFLEAIPDENGEMQYVPVKEMEE